MIAPGGELKVYVATRPVDFRKGIDGLALAVQEMFGLDPFCGAAFVCRSKRASRQSLRIQISRSEDRVFLASSGRPGLARPRRWAAAGRRIGSG
jgi:IS66 Orf2 like protein